MGKTKREDKYYDRRHSEEAFERKLEQHRQEKERLRKLEKKNRKEIETPEERIIRRNAKKLQKEEIRRAKDSSIFPESIPYTNQNNPFNDPNLTTPFIWEKKLQVEGKANLSQKKIEKMHRDNLHHNVAEMEELKRQREARQQAKEELEMLSRDMDRSQNSDLNIREYMSDLKNAKLRSEIRLKENRAKPIDLLARYIEYGNGEGIEEFEFEEPLNYLKGCSTEDYEDLDEDIKRFKEIHGKKNDKYWDDLSTIVKNELKSRRGRNDEAKNIHQNIMGDIINKFKGKVYDDLVLMHSQIRHRLTTEIDKGFWEAILNILNQMMAKQRLKELHTQMLKERLKKIREEQSREMAEYEDQKGERSNKEDSKSILKSATKLPKDDMKEEEDLRIPVNSKLPFTLKEMEQWDDETKEQNTRNLNEYQLETLSTQLYNNGGYSPHYGGEEQAMPGIEILVASEDSKKLWQLRLQNKQCGSGARIGATEIEQKMYSIASEGMNSKEEEVFNDETELGQQSYMWADKYRPQKPRYFNRVHTGFDWNKYNQTHYDVDNPPPKIVQGYRFNIFFPDLLDVSQTPSFKLIECEDKDFAILRFKGGPPYEDIAFKIVNREWEINHKHGYKCQFQNGIFQLWFFFKRYRYRR